MKIFPYLSLSLPRIHTHTNSIDFHIIFAQQMVVDEFKEFQR